MTKTSFAPILLFTYNRPLHTRRTVEALQSNQLATDSELFIYSDGQKCEADQENVQAVRSYVRSIRGFKKIKIVERENNWGLADSITDGVTQVVNEYGRVIVLEDDVVTAPFFLRFMNDALDFYSKEEKVWHISGWNYPIASRGLPDSFLWRVMNCWGWATWTDRWQHYKRDPDSLMTEFTREDIKRFNLDGKYDFWYQVKGNVEGRFKTWAVFWYAAIFKHNGLCLNPTQSLAENIGRDGSGVHCGTLKNKKGKDSLYKPVIHNFPEKILEDEAVVDNIKKMIAAKKYKLSMKGFLCRLSMRA